MEILAYIGNKEILHLPKTAFLCSRKIPASAVLKCYDWAIAQREAGNCVISGFHSQIEKDVLHYLLKGKQPIILALARGLKEKLEPKFEKSLEQGRLLIISPFDKSINSEQSSVGSSQSTIIDSQFATSTSNLKPQTSNLKLVNHVNPVKNEFTP